MKDRRGLLPCNCGRYPVVIGYRTKEMTPVAPPDSFYIACFSCQYETLAHFGRDAAIENWNKKMAKERSSLFIL